MGTWRSCLLLSAVAAVAAIGCADDQDGGTALPADGPVYSDAQDLADDLGCAEATDDPSQIGDLSRVLDGTTVRLRVFEDRDAFTDSVQEVAAGVCEADRADPQAQVPMTAGNRWLLVGPAGTSDALTSRVAARDDQQRAALSIVCEEAT